MAATDPHGRSGPGGGPSDEPGSGPGGGGGGSGNPGVRFETVDVDPTSILKFGFGLLVATLLVAWLMRLLFISLAERAARSQPPPPVMKMESRRQPPPPRLQEQPFADIGKMRAEESDVLEGYGWVDEKAGIVRIPIDRAMDLVADRGLPVRTSPRTDTSPRPQTDTSPQRPQTEGAKK